MSSLVSTKKGGAKSVRAVGRPHEMELHERTTGYLCALVRVLAIAGDKLNGRYFMKSRVWYIVDSCAVFSQTNTFLMTCLIKAECFRG